ncbi:radical SAM protein [soil metagenome]
MKAIKRLPGYLRTLRQINRREPSLPRFLTYTVTYTCNARCIMCDSWKMESPNDLKLDEIEGIFDQFPRMDAVRLTGGEPFVRKDLLEIAHLAQRKLKPFFLHITSNGFLTDRIVKFCEDREKDIPLNLLVSVDGMKEKHNHVRGKDTAWDSVMKTLHALAPRRKELRMSLAVNQTIVDADGAEQYRLLRDALKPLGIRNNMVMAYDASATYSLEKNGKVAASQIGKFSTFGEFSPEQLDDLLKEVEADAEHYPIAEKLAKRYYLKGIRSRLMNGGSTPNPKCVALSAHMRIFPNGDVPTCQFNGKTIGNLRSNTFNDVWYGEEAKKLRAWVNKCPGCWAECEVLPSAIYSGDLLKRSLFPAKA